MIRQSMAAIATFGFAAISTTASANSAPLADLTKTLAQTASPTASTSDAITRDRFERLYQYENGRYYKQPRSFNRGVRCWKEAHPDKGPVKVCGAR